MSATKSEGTRCSSMAGSGIFYAKRNIPMKLIGSNWTRLSMVSWIINIKVQVICLSLRLWQITQTRGLIIHNIMRKPNLTIVLSYIFLKNCKRRHNSLSCKIHEQGRYILLGRLWTRRDKPISAADIGLSS